MALGQQLGRKIGNERSRLWLAKQLMVSPATISFWTTGRCRPRPYRIGYLARIFDFTEEELAELTLLADYDVDQHEEALTAYHEWPKVQNRWQLARDARRKFTDWALEQVLKDEQLQHRLAQEHPNLYETMKEVFA